MTPYELVQDVVRGMVSSYFDIRRANPSHDRDLLLFLEASQKHGCPQDKKRTTNKNTCLLARFRT